MGWDFLSKLGPLGEDNSRKGRGYAALLQNPLAPVKKAGQQGLKASLFRASADQEVGEALAQTTTISCSVLDSNFEPSYEPVSASYRLVGTIKWGTGGVQHEARFDWLHGACVRVNGAAFEVTCELLETDGRGEDIPEDLYVQVGASIGYGTNGQTIAATYTTLDVDNPRSVAGTRFFDVPSFARRAVVVFNNQGGPTYSARWLGTLIAFDIDPSLDDHGPLYIPSGAYALYFEPVTAELGDVSVIWELAL